MKLLQRIHHLLFLGLGPPEIDASGSPDTRAADAGHPCPLCEHPMSAHETSPLDGGRGRQMQCPASTAAEAAPPPAPAA
ncbi:hypothetical protein [Angustibacter aerolatus]